MIKHILLKVSFRVKRVWIASEAGLYSSKFVEEGISAGIITVPRPFGVPSPLMQIE
jgi:hypothetical protein